MPNYSQIRVNGKRLWESLMRMAEIGKTVGGGCNRQALTHEDQIGRDLFCEWCSSAGCEVRTDEVGNIFARRPGFISERPPILFGSHLDTQPTGGKFDGVYGVLAGLEVIRTLNDAELGTLGPIEVVSWTNEEGSRFSPAMAGSGAWSGNIPLDDILDQKDLHGISFQDELERIGYSGKTPASAFPVRAALEVHIEQGPILEKEDLQIGVVTGVQGMRWLDIKTIGTSAHAGTTPMSGRNDAVITLSKVIARFTEDLHQFGEAARATFSSLRSEPLSRNTVQSVASASLDIRHPNDEELDKMEKVLQLRLNNFSKSNGTKSSLTRLSKTKSTIFSEFCLSAIKKATENLGYKQREMISGAVHDSVYVSRTCPTAMIFVPCLRGVSHNESESALPGDLTAGCNVLLQTILLLDRQFQ